MKKKTATQRVDVQVTILVALLVVISTAIVFFFAYTLSYKHMLQSLEDRVSSLAMYLDKELTSPLFTNIVTQADMGSAEYQNTHTFLSRAREISSAQYLYTATKNKDGKLIYHIDGLPEDHKDFRKLGDLIEPDFQSDLALALEGNIVMPEDIKNTAWGDVFVAYYPIHHEKTNEVIGALGVEFPANREYQAYSRIRTLTPFVILLTCIVASIISHILFRRISNPHFKDLANTDSLTGLKNRNAYNFDIRNLIQSERTQNYALILADLNGLKVINDKNGHKAGDTYIQQFAAILEAQEKENSVSYRIGGDEFATFFFNPSEQEILHFIHTVKTLLKEKSQHSTEFYSVSMGYAFSKKLTKESWEKIQQEADSNLYQDKKMFYEQHTAYNNRRE